MKRIAKFAAPAMLAAMLTVGAGAGPASADEERSAEQAKVAQTVHAPQAGVQRTKEE
jgi:hypothetical protein